MVVCLCTGVWMFPLWLLTSCSFLALLLFFLFFLSPRASLSFLPLLVLSPLCASLLSFVLVCVLPGLCALFVCFSLVLQLLVPLYPIKLFTLVCITPNIGPGHIPNITANPTNGNNTYISRRVTSLGASIMYPDIAPKLTRLYMNNP